MIEKLRALSMFRAFDDETLAALARRVTTTQLGDGETLFEEGDEGETFYIVDSGEVAIRKEGKTLALLRDGQIFGEMALVRKEPRSATARARTNCEVVPIDNRRFKRVRFPSS